MFFDTPAALEGIDTPAWKTTAVQQLLGEGYRQSAPYAVGGREEAIVDVVHPTFLFSTDAEKTVIYKGWLVDNGYYSLPVTAPDIVTSLAGDLTSVLSASTPANRGIFYVAVIGAVALYFVFRRRKK